MRYVYIFAALTLMIAGLVDFAFAGAGDVIDCRQLADDRERLACYDRTVAPFQEQQQKQQDKASAGAFFGLFGDAAKPTRDAEFGKTVPQPAAPDAIPEVTSLTANITRVNSSPNGHQLFVLDNGQIWRSQENRSALISSSQQNKAEIEKSLLGFGYMMRINDAHYQISVTRIK